MKREAWQHSKFKLVARDLGISLCHVRGIMESLWLQCSISFPAGDIGRMTNEMIAIGIDYDGDPDRLVQVLIDRELLDQIEPGRLYVHDWHEHCDDATHMRLARNVMLFANGVVPRTSRLSEKERIKVVAKFEALGVDPKVSEDTVFVRTVSAHGCTTLHSVRQPSPAPPEPSINTSEIVRVSVVDTFDQNGVLIQNGNHVLEEPSNSLSQANIPAGGTPTVRAKSEEKKPQLDETFSKFWQVYWNKKSKKKARDSWPRALNRVIKEHGNGWKGTEAAEYLVSQVVQQRREIEADPDLDWMANMHPTTWLNGARWEDKLKSDIGYAKKPKRPEGERIPDLVIPKRRDLNG